VHLFALLEEEKLIKMFRVRHFKICFFVYWRLSVYGLGLAIASTWMTANNGSEMAWKNDIMAYPKAFNVFTFYAEACKVLVAYPMIFKVLVGYPKAFKFLAAYPKHLRSSRLILRHFIFSQLILRHLILSQLILSI
jgi:hypothetical protein